ncbi:YceI family protein [Hyphomonas sp.]|uniref:YceI family protein n=1 Tax=Hyphomonas sp. TaxID=87 RepID=UPI0025C0C5C4|nr:YceI family protein [Hyphomonas sp.]
MRVRRLALAGLASVALASAAACTSVIAPILKPDVSTDVSGMEGGDWQLDPAHAAITFKIDHLGYSTFIGRFERFDVRLSGQPDSPETARVEGRVDMTSLDIANDAFAETLMGPDWFNADPFPEARFQSTRILLTGPVTADVEGLLTLRGRTAPIVLAVRFNGSGHDRLRNADVAGFSATARLDRTDFGIDRFSGLLTDDVEIEIEAELIKTPGVT